MFLIKDDKMRPPWSGLRMFAGHGIRSAFRLSRGCRKHILIQPEEVVWVIVRLHRHHSVPPFAVSLGHTVLFVAAHEIHVDAGLHRRTKFVE